MDQNRMDHPMSKDQIFIKIYNKIKLKEIINII